MDHTPHLSEASQVPPSAAETLLRLMRTGDIPSAWRTECERDAYDLKVAAGFVI